MDIPSLKYKLNTAYYTPIHRYNYGYETVEIKFVKIEIEIEYSKYTKKEECFIHYVTEDNMRFSQHDDDDDTIFQTAEECDNWCNEANAPY